MSCGGGGYIFRETIDLIAGDQSDFLLLAWPTYTPSQNGPEILHIFLSTADAAAYDWTLFFATQAGATASNVVIIDSGEVGIASPNPSGVVTVGNRRSECSHLVPYSSGAPMTLRMTTSGKVGVGRVRIAWRWADGM